MTNHRCNYTLAAGIALIMLIAVICLIISRPLTIIDTHEHISSVEEADILYKLNVETGISRSILLPSPTETLTLNGHRSFTGYRENTDVIFDIAEKYPDHFIPFCTINPLDSDATEYLQGCIKQGGKGIKLYNGHSYYYEVFNLPLDNARMHPIYSFAEREKIPILFHVNVGKYEDQLRLLLEAHPKLTVSVPHYMVSSIKLEKVEKLLNDFPNLYTDISFGSPEFMAAGFRRISKNPGKYANFINTHPDRVLFGADMVLTDNEDKGEEHIRQTTQCYMNLLSERRFECQPVKDYYENQLALHQERYDACKPKDGDYCETLKGKMDTYQSRLDDVQRLNGLGLSHSILKKIYETNPKRFLRANR